MNYAEASRQLPYMEPIDLNDFGDLRLSDQGELAVDSVFKHEIILKLGNNLLELSKIPFPEEPVKRRLPAPASTAYILKNLHPNARGASVIIDDGINATDEVLGGFHDYEIYRRSSLVVGREADATPGLKLSDQASRHHMSLRLGSLQGNVHFMDLGSSNGTVVYLHPNDRNMPGTPRRTVLFDKKTRQPRLKTDVEQSWLR